MYNYIINSFYKTIPHSRNLVSLSVIDDIILKINNNDIENIIESTHDLRENLLYMLSFEKLNMHEQHNVKQHLLNDNDEYYLFNIVVKCILLLYKWK